MDKRNTVVDSDSFVGSIARKSLTDLGLNRRGFGNGY